MVSEPLTSMYVVFKKRAVLLLQKDMISAVNKECVRQSFSISDQINWRYLQTEKCKTFWWSTLIVLKVFICIFVFEPKSQVFFKYSFLCLLHHDFKDRYYHISIYLMMDISHFQAILPILSYFWSILMMTFSFKLALRAIYFSNTMWIGYTTYINTPFF